MARKTVLVSDPSGDNEKDSAQVVIKYGDARRGQITLDVLASGVGELASKGRKGARAVRTGRGSSGNVRFRVCRG